MFQIYKITNILNGKIYIGKTSRTPEARWKEHVYDVDAGSKEYFHCAIRKYGKNNFVISLIDMGEDGNRLEQHYISSLKSYDRKVGYNSTMGGEGVIPTREIKLKLKGHPNFFIGGHSEESKKKISKGLTGNKNSLGYKHSEETKQRMRESHLGKKHKMGVNHGRFREQDSPTN